jgi:hypothetical protein
MCRKHNQDLGRDLGNQLKRRAPKATTVTDRKGE